MKRLPVYLRVYQGALLVFTLVITLFFGKLIYFRITSLTESPNLLKIGLLIFLLAIFIIKAIVSFRLIQIFNKKVLFKDMLQIAFVILFIAHFIFEIGMSILVIEFAHKMTFIYTLYNEFNVFVSFLFTFSVYILIVDVILFLTARKVYTKDLQNQINSIN